MPSEVPSSVPAWVYSSSLMMAGIGVYLWWRLVYRTTAPRSLARRIGNVIGALVVLSAPVALIGQFAMPMGFQRITGWPAWIGYAFIVSTAMIAVLLEPVRLVVWLRRRRAQRHSAEEDQISVPAGDAATPSAAEAISTSPTSSIAEPISPDDAEMARGVEVETSAEGSAVIADPTVAAPVQPTGSKEWSRRLLFERGLALGTVVVGTAITGIGLVNAVSTPSVVRRTIALRNLPAEAVGMRIAMVTDLHVSGVIRASTTRRVVDLVNAQNPDVVCLIGDFSDGSAEVLGSELQPLADLRATEGVYFVTGNHEFYFDVESWYRFLPTLGVQVLRNESTEVRGVLLAGVHDPTGEPYGSGPDIELAVQDRKPDQPVILLSHTPDLLDDAIASGVDLMLSGHTHGGQFVPGVWIVGLTTKTLAGHYTFGDTQVQVSRGAGFWGPIARTGAPSDITVLELARA